jgi:hypothetical protein
MRKSATALLLGSIFLACVMSAPSVYAQGSQEPPDPTAGHGMMGSGHMKGTSRMMSGCGGMMQSNPDGGRPNDQWRNHQV